MAMAMKQAAGNHSLEIQMQAEDPSHNGSERVWVM